MQRSSLDQSDITDLRRLLSALLGGFAGHNGHIFDPEQHRGLLEYQAEMLTSEGNEEPTMDALKNYDLINDKGLLNHDQFQRFGAFTRREYGVERAEREDLKKQMKT